MKIYTIAFEGMNCCGKGTQIQLLANRLSSLKIPYVILRGDSGRSGLGLSEGDPFDVWWQDFHAKFHQKNITDQQRSGLIKKGARKIAEELLIWKNVKMVEKAKATRSKLGIILQDRTFISVMTPLAQNNENYSLETIYSGIKWKMLIPDIIFYLEAPKEVLFDRLSRRFDLERQAREARERIITQNYGSFLDVLEGLSDFIQKRVVRLDANQPPLVMENIIYSRVIYF